MSRADEPVHDPLATGPRDWREYAAMRDAHRGMSNITEVGANDRDRVRLLTRRAREGDRSSWPLAPCSVNAPRCPGHARKDG